MDYVTDMCLSLPAFLLLNFLPFSFLPSSFSSFYFFSFSYLILLLVLHVPLLLLISLLRVLLFLPFLLHLLHHRTSLHLHNASLQHAPPCPCRPHTITNVLHYSFQQPDVSRGSFGPFPILCVSSAQRANREMGVGSLCHSASPPGYFSLLFRAPEESLSLF